MSPPPPATLTTNAPRRLAPQAAGGRSGARVRTAPATRRVSRTRGFNLFWAARAISQFGDEVSVLALPWLIAEMTSSPLAVALLEALVFAPVLLLGLPIGALADRRSRKRSMVESDLVRLLAVGSIPVAALIGLGTSLAHVLAVVVLAGTFRILFEASSQAALPDLVPAHAVVGSNARLAFTEGLAAICGPALAGVLIATIGTQGTVAVDALTFAISGCAIALVIIPRERHQRARESMGSAVRAGLAMVRGVRHLRTLTLVSGASNVAAGMAVGMSAIFFQRVLGVDGWEAGLVYGANGVGGVFGSMLSTHLIARIGLGRATLVGITSTATGILLLGLSAGASWFVTATTGSGAVGFGIAIAVIASASLRQRVVPSAMLGRVTSTYRLVVNGAIAFGAITGGLVAHSLGVRTAMIAAAGLMFVVVVAALATCLNGPDPAPVEVGGEDPDRS